MIIVWISVAVITFIFEIITVGGVESIWFTIGALVALALAYFNVNATIQLFAFVIVSIGVMLLVKPLASKYLRGNIVKTNTDRLIGQIAEVTEEIAPDKWGQVVVNKTIWSATEKENDVIAVGEKVRIIDIEGARLIVKKTDSISEKGE